MPSYGTNTSKSTADHEELNVQKNRGCVASKIRGSLPTHLQQILHLLQHCPKTWLPWDTSIQGDSTWLFDPCIDVASFNHLTNRYLWLVIAGEPPMMVIASSDFVVPIVAQCFGDTSPSSPINHLARVHNWLLMIACICSFQRQVRVNLARHLHQSPL